MKNRANPVLPMFNAEEFHNPPKEKQRVQLEDLREKKRINNGLYDIYGKL